MNPPSTTVHDHVQDNALPDHRRIGRQLGVFATDESLGAGLPLWLPAGAAIRWEVERYIVELERRHGYRHVHTPVLAKRELYERSGHWAHYRDDMYPPMDVGGDQVVLRPMNCPHHVLVFGAERPSLGELPYRLAELAPMFRFERSGVVGGLSRTRQMTLSDGHVFCTPDQIHDEISDMLSMVGAAYDTLGIPRPRFRLSLRDEGPKFVDDDDMWARSEAALRSTLVDHGLPFTEAPGEAAFYGPKIDLQVSDPQGREETLSTIQVDFHLPERFDLFAEHGPHRVRPVMIHRSIVSTMERMVAHLLEVHDGAMPPWLAPVQVRVVPIEPLPEGHVAAVRDAFLRRGLRVDVDARDATLGARIRQARLDKVPWTAVVGPREAADGTVALRLRAGAQRPPAALQSTADDLGALVDSRSPDLWPA